MNRFLKYRRTKKGFITQTYLRQKQSSKTRGHQQPCYTKDLLWQWVKNQSSFESIWNNWVNNDYKKDLRPSIDRLRDDLPYSLDNIQLVTWGENNKKSHTNRINGVDKSRSKSVIQLTLDGELIEKFHSSHDAMRKTKVQQSNIIQVCKGNRNVAGGFKWSYNYN